MVFAGNVRGFKMFEAALNLQVAAKCTDEDAPNEPF